MSASLVRSLGGALLGGLVFAFVTHAVVQSTTIAPLPGALDADAVGRAIDAGRCRFAKLPDRSAVAITMRDAGCYDTYIYRLRIRCGDPVVVDAAFGSEWSDAPLISHRGSIERSEFVRLDRALDAYRKRSPSSYYASTRTIDITWPTGVESLEVSGFALLEEYGIDGMDAALDFGELAGRIASDT